MERKSHAVNQAVDAIIVSSSPRSSSDDTLSPSSIPPSQSSSSSNLLDESQHTQQYHLQQHITNHRHAFDSVTPPLSPEQEHHQHFAEQHFHAMAQEQFLRHFFHPHSGAMGHHALSINTATGMSPADGLAQSSPTAAEAATRLLEISKTSNGLPISLLTPQTPIFLLTPGTSSLTSADSPNHLLAAPTASTSRRGATSVRRAGTTNQKQRVPWTLQEDDCLISGIRKVCLYVYPKP